MYMDTKMNDRFVASSVLIMKDVIRKVGNRKKKKMRSLDSDQQRVTTWRLGKMVKLIKKKSSSNANNTNYLTWIGMDGLDRPHGFGQTTWPEHSPEHYQAQPKQSACVQIHVVAGLFFLRLLEFWNEIMQLNSWKVRAMSRPTERHKFLNSVWKHIQPMATILFHACN